MDGEIIPIKSRLIVNKRGARPVTSYHVNFLKAGFLRNGYIPTHLLTCRAPTAWEIADFYAQEPHMYQKFAEKNRAQEELKNPNAGGHVYCIDGLHRRKVVLDLIEDQQFSEDFRLWARMVKDLGPENEIAMSISLNSSNEYSIKLSPCSLVLQYSRYDQIVNDSGRKKSLSAAEVGRRMVQCGGSDKQLGEKTVKAMAETRRQVIGISRKLPVLALRYLDSLQEKNPKCAEAAFTIANLKAVPKLLTDDEAVALLRRMSNFHKTQIPVPKAMAPHHVSENVFFVRRAIKAVKVFMSLCEYTRLPAELRHLVGQMKNTDKHDEALADCSYEGEEIYADLAQECEKLVAVGNLKITIARKKMTKKKHHVAREQQSTSSLEITACYGQEREQNSTPFPSELETIGSPKNFKADIGEQHEMYTKQMSKRVSKTKDIQKKARLVTDDLKELPGWKLMNCSVEDFEKRREEWRIVESSMDFAIFDIPQDSRNQDCIDKLVRHIGSSLKVTGVAHAFCSALQFSQVVDAATKIGLTAISSPMLYIPDVLRIKRLTYSLQPQDIVQYAAVFFKRSTKAAEKHFFSSREEYEHSVTPSWTNVVSNISPSRCRLTDSGGRPFDALERPKELYKFIIRRRCRPGGMCYNPLALTMVAGLAAYEIGIRYVAVEGDQRCFEAARKRILDTASRSIKRPISGIHLKGVEKTSTGIWSFLKKAKPFPSKATHSKSSEGIVHSTNNNDMGSRPSSSRTPLPLCKAQSEYPDRQEVPTDSESDESVEEIENKHKLERTKTCAAAELCLLKSGNAPPTHVCGMCQAPIHNLCDYGKRVQKDFSRENIFACSKKCYFLENQSAEDKEFI